MTPSLKRKTTLLIAMTASTFLNAAAQQELVCVNSNKADKEIVLNELITTGNGNYKYTEVKVIKNGIDILPFELCMGSLPFNEDKDGNPILGCKGLGSGDGIWYDDATITALLDDNGPNSTSPTTYYNPTWITYQNTDVLAQGEGQMDSAKGQIVLREKATKNVVDYICYSTGNDCKNGTSSYYQSPSRLADTSIDPTDPDSVCWNEFVVGANSTKVFGRADPDGTGDFTELPTGDPTTGNSNDPTPPVVDQVAAVCSAIDNGTFVPVYSKSLLTLSSATVRITNKSGAQNSFSTAGSYSNGASITAQALYQYGKYLPPQVIPSYSGPANNVNNDVTLSSTSTLGAGSYDVVTVPEGASAGTGGASGSTYRLNSLLLRSNSQLNLVAGTYHIGQLNLAAGASINITSGPVKLIIGSNLTLQSNAQLMDSVSDPSNLTIYLSAGTLVAAEMSKITGTIVTASGTTATFTNDSSLHGSIFGLGDVAFSSAPDPVKVNYSADAIKAQRSLYQCPTPPTVITTVSIVPSTPVSALTCQPQPVTLNVTKSDGTAYTGTLNLTTSSNRGNWLDGSLALIAGNGTADDGAASVTFSAADAGIKNLQLSHTSFGSTTVTATDSVTSSITANSGIITFSDAGLLWLDSASNVIDPTNPLTLVAGTAQNVQLRAVKQSTTPGVCTGIFANGANVPLSIGSTCVDPNTCAIGQQLQGVNNGTFTIGNPQNAPSMSNKTITFGANSTATISLMSPDVGKMDLVAGYAGSATSPALSGATTGGSVVSKPANLKITNVRTASTPSVVNPAASTVAGDVFAKAGERFFADVTSYNSLGDVTPSFGRESVTPQPILSASMVAPTIASGGNAGVVGKSGNWIPGATGSGSLVFDTSSATDGLTYSEVGAITLTPALGNYLGAGAVSGATSNTIGRFRPAKFVLSANVPSLSTALATCQAIYRGQTMTFNTPPTITITAVNTDGVTTKNYDNEFFQLPSTLQAGAFALSQSGTPWSPAMTSTQSWSPLSGYDGIAALQFNSFLLDRSGEPTIADAPIVNPILRIQFNASPTGTSLIQDLDGVCLEDTGTCNNAIWDLQFSPLQWLYGRISMTNNNGAETEPLTMPVVAEYWDGERWKTNTLENGACTVLTTGDFTQSPWTAATGSPSTNVTNWTGFSLGLASYDLTAPGAGNTGKVTITGSVPNWLKAWDGTGFTLDPSATAVFGIYRGRPPILFKTQVFR